MMNNPLVYIDVKGDSVELIIGKPYIDSKGKEHPYGHVALRVFNATEGYNIIYDFGRYGGVRGFLDSEGDGILNVYNDGDSYLKSEMKTRSSVGYMKPTTTYQDKLVMAHFSTMIKEGNVYKNGVVPGGGGTAYKLKRDYHVLKNNCTTVSCGGLEVIGMNWLEDEFDPRNAMHTMEEGYKNFLLARTEYKKGGMISLTYTPPALKLKNLDKIKLPSMDTAFPQDNTSVYKTEVVIIPLNRGQ